MDRILELESGRALAQKNVTVNEPYFRGHFPQAPVMPGVLVLECMLQLAWLMHSERGGSRLEKVRRLKFRRSVVPGDKLLLEVTRVGEEASVVQLRAVARLEDKVAVEGDLWVRTDFARAATGVEGELANVP